MDKGGFCSFELIAWSDWLPSGDKMYWADEEVEELNLGKNGYNQKIE